MHSAPEPSAGKRLLVPALLASGLLAALGYFGHRLHEQDQEIARLRGLSERPPANGRAREGATAPIRESERASVEDHSPASRPAPPGASLGARELERAGEPADPDAAEPVRQANGGVEPERSDEERKARQEANLARLFADFQAQPIDEKAARVQQEFQLAVDAVLEEGGNFKLERGALECRSGWCSMPIEYESGAKLDELDRAMHEAAARLPGESVPVMSRLTKPAANGTARDGRYFFRWKAGTW